jgi:TolB-like protein/class 3 adenylate cyclase
MERRLAAVLMADVVGYSRLIEADEAGTLAILKERRTSILDPTVRAHGGRIVKVMGDGVLVEFASAVNAVAGAVDLLRKMMAANADLPDARRIVLRIGINLGDVIGEGGDIYGEGVNIAARLESLAEPGGICISSKVHEEVRGKLSATFEDMGEQTVKNVARPVRAYRWRAEGARDGAPQLDPALALPDKPSIAVLPFQNMSGDAEQDYFADGMVEEIITALSRIRWLFVIARNSTFAYKGQAVDVKRIGRELGVRYVLEGSVRRSAGKLRIAGQLIDASSGAHLWADRFDGTLEDIFDLQDQLTANVVGPSRPSSNKPKSSGSSASRPKASMPTTVSFAAWQACISGRETATKRPCRTSTERSSSIPILPPPMASLRGPMFNEIQAAGSGIAARRSSKPRDLRAGRSSWAKTMRWPCARRDLRWQISAEKPTTVMPSSTGPSRSTPTSPGGGFSAAGSRPRSVSPTLRLSGSPAPSASVRTTLRRSVLRPRWPSLTSLPGAMGRRCPVQKQRRATGRAISWRP